MVAESKCNLELTKEDEEKLDKVWDEIARTKNLTLQPLGSEAEVLRQ